MTRTATDDRVDGNGEPVQVHVHVHLAVTGTFPLRVADLLFTESAVLVPEYEYLTPLFGIARGRMSDAGDTARERYHEDGVGGLVEAAERTHRLPYGDVERVRIYDDSGVGRPKVAVDVPAGPPYGYRIHAAVDVDQLSEALGSLGRRKGFDVETSSGLGFRPATSLRRFLADR